MRSAQHGRRDHPRARRHAAMPAICGAAGDGRPGDGVGRLSAATRRVCVFEREKPRASGSALTSVKATKTQLTAAKHYSLLPPPNILVVGGTLHTGRRLFERCIGI
jgi:hypothetical protein